MTQAPILAVTMLVAACAPLPRGADAEADVVAQRLPEVSIALLGEVHDNAEGHRLRYEALARAVRAGWRPAIAMEQFDRERQPALDRAMQECGDAACVIHAAAPGNAGWDWKLYEPVIDLALREKLPLAAANLSRTDAGRVVRQGLPAVFSPDELRQLGLAGGPPDALLAAQRREVAQGHCGLLPASMEPAMATAQIARDAMMAQVMMRAARPADGVAQRPVVLLAGNGHVRRDLGVPRWLPAGSLAVGFTEGPPPPGSYDLDVELAAAERGDPCEELRAGAKSMPAQGMAP
ncbi:ChaN family lipoprotein [Pigmentiphaga soli]